MADFFKLLLLNEIAKGKSQKEPRAPKPALFEAIKRKSKPDLTKAISEIKQANEAAKLDSLCPNKSYTPLLYAIRKKWREGAKILLTEGANPWKGGDDEFPPVFYAAKENEPALVRLMLDTNTADVDFSYTMGNYSLNAIEHLLFSPSGKPSGPTPVSAFRVLMERIQVNPHLHQLITKPNPTLEYDTPLHLAAFREHNALLLSVMLETLRVISTPEQYRERLAIRGEYDYTPLHLAAHAGNYTAAEMLLNAGADENIEIGDNDQKPVALATNKHVLCLFAQFKFSKTLPPPLV
jgi:Ankyrin repeats (3 copies)